MTDYLRLPSQAASGGVNAIVETPRLAPAKIKYDPGLGCFTLSRHLVPGLVYPYSWGFVPSTCAADGDPLDVMILSDMATHPGLVMPSRPVGVLEVEQTEQGRSLRNDRVFVVPMQEPRWSDLRSALDLPEAMRRELERFFVASVAGTGKLLRMLGWRDGEAARQTIGDAENAFARRAKT